MRANTHPPLSFCGQAVNAKELSLIQQVIERYPNLSRTELANTLCELLNWSRPNGGLKTVESRQFLETLEARSILQLPQRRFGRPRGSKTRVVRTASGAGGEPLEGVLGDYPSILITLVTSAGERALWRELVDRHHYLGHRVPFGAHLRYLIRLEDPSQTVVGCLQYSSGAWRMQARDGWIGWEEAQRKRHLQRVVSNSRFLILPWVRIRYLASHVLSRAARRLPQDWAAHYGLAPWLLETLVDPARFEGTCYRAANWIEVGTTTGRGRQDCHHRRHGAQPKKVWLYPLRRDARQRLRQAG
ncbi:MAG: Druantia anti-phage system protein DruA [Pseudomonadota bacterium]